MRASHRSGMERKWLVLASVSLDSLTATLDARWRASRRIPATAAVADYGAADSVVGLATAQFSDVMARVLAAPRLAG